MNADERTLAYGDTGDAARTSLPRRECLLSRLESAIEAIKEKERRIDRVEFPSQVRMFLRFYEDSQER